jgi:hypothetical protein
LKEANHDQSNDYQTVHRRGLAIITGAIVAFIAIGIGMANDIFVMKRSRCRRSQGKRARVLPPRSRHRRHRRDHGRSDRGSGGWIGALLNTWQLDSKAWFVALLLLGIFNFGFFAMIAFLAAGPDGMSDAQLQKAQAPRATPA